MRFSCDKCNSQYSIADERVRGKKLRVRCKKCQNEIVVHGGALVAAAPQADAGDDEPLVRPDPDRTRQVSTAELEQALARSRAPEAAPAPAARPKAAPAPAAARTPAPARPAPAPAPARAAPPAPAAASAPAREWWYAMIGGKQSAAIHLEELHRMVREAEVLPKTYVWKEGTSGWIRARDAAELQAVFAELERPAPPLPPPPPPEAVEDTDAGPQATTIGDEDTVPGDSAALEEALRAREEEERREAEARERAAKEKAAAERAAKEKAAAERAAKEKAAAERAAKEKAAAEMAAAEKALAQQEEADKAAKDGAAKAREDEEKRAREKAEREKAAREKEEQERKKKEKTGKKPGAAPEPEKEKTPAPPAPAAMAAQVEKGTPAAAKPAGANGAVAAPVVGGAAAAADPFAAVPDAPGMIKEPGEITKIVIARAGAGKSHTWKAFAALGLMFAGIGVAVWQIMQNPQVFEFTPSLSGGGSRREAVGGSGTDSDALSGLMKKDRPPPAPASGSGVAAAGEGASVGGAPARPKDVDTEGAIVQVEQKKGAVLSASDKKFLEGLYASDPKGPAEIKLKPVSQQTPEIEKAEISLPAEVVSKKFTDNLSAFQLCMQAELKRNPDARPGKVKLKLTIAPSGVVSEAVIVEGKVDPTSDLGHCLKKTAKRIVFPAFAGEAFDVEAPLLLAGGG